MKKFLKNNGLSVVFLMLFLASISGQIIFGFKEHNKELTEEGGHSIELLSYLLSGHFVQATFENWESEFLQMALFVILTIFLYQRGSSESKVPDQKEEVDREPLNHKDAPLPVKKGGFYLWIYENSLSIVLTLLFIISFTLHFMGSLSDENEKLMLKALPRIHTIAYISDPRFWFESFQNWQSEFLSVFVLVVLSVFLRQKGSPQSKPVDAPNDETGE